MANEVRLRSNFLFGTITDNPLSNVATTINGPTLSFLPVVDATNHLMLVLDPTGINGAPEIVKVTAHTAAATSVTVVRGQDGSAARAHQANETWYFAPVVSDYNFTDVAALSTNRPATPFQGELIYETDTNSYVGRAAGSVWQTVVPLGAWTTFTPTVTQLGNVTFTNDYSRFRRVGREITAAIHLTVTGAGTGANIVTVTLPVLNSAPTNTDIGIGTIYDSSANIFYGGIAEISATPQTIVYRSTSTDTGTALGATVFTAALAVGDLISYTVTYEAAS